MDKPISPTLHGALDYATVLLTAAAPSLFGFSDRAANTCYALVGGYLALPAGTDYPLAARRLVPFPAHGAAEGALGAALPLLPKLLGFSRDRAARNFLLGLTAVTAVVATLTDWTATPSGSASPGAVASRDPFGLPRQPPRDPNRRGVDWPPWARVALAPPPFHTGRQPTCQTTGSGTSP